MIELNNLRWYKTIFIALLVVSVLSGCKKDTDEKEKNFSYLIDWQLIDNVNKTSIQLFTSLNPDINNLVSGKELQNVYIYKINDLRRFV